MRMLGDEARLGCAPQRQARSHNAVKLVAILDSPAPYTTPVLNAVADRVDLHVVYLSPEDRVSRFVDSLGVDPAFDYSLHWARRLDIPSVDFHLELTLGMARRLNALNPDAILLVSWKPTVAEPLAWSRWSGAAAVMWAESTPFSGLLRGPASTIVRRILTRAFDGYVSNGSQATQYLEQLGVPGERIVTSILPAAKSPPATARTRHPEDDAVGFLFVGRLIPQKRPLELIEAFTAVRQALPGATLTVVGGGELEAEVREAATHVHGVHCLGHLEGAELAAVYSRSDVLVLPAVREVWGLVVNEALAHGLFVVTTDQVGSAFDLLDRETGVVLPAEDLSLLAPSLVEVGRTVELGDAARQRRASAVASCTPAAFAADIGEAVELATRVRATRWRSRRSQRSARPTRRM
jgi:glycosyltransferase involved in cell wall biosynthesis